MPPLCIVKGVTKRSLDAFDLNSAPARKVRTWQENAWMEDSLRAEWLHKVFPHRCNLNHPQLLLLPLLMLLLVLLDGHCSHEPLDLIEAARQENIHVSALPSHVTHYLQQLDRSCFGPLKNAYNKTCNSYLIQSR